jgi:hypothetical protein
VIIQTGLDKVLTLGNPGLQVLSRTVGSFSPLSITGMVFWLKADGTLWQDSGRTTPAVANSDPVGAWDDASGNVRHFLQTTPGDRPLFYTNALNNLPGVKVGDVSDQLNSPSITHGIGTGDFYIVFVAQKTSTGDRLLLQNTTSENPDFYISESPANKFAVYGPGDMPFSVLSAANHIIEFQRNAGTLSAVVDGTADPTTYSAGFSFANGIQYLFGNSTGQRPLGYLFEMILYKGLPSSGQRTSLRSYLNTKWAVY